MTNPQRGHLTAEERERVVADLRETNSAVQTARRLGVNVKTVNRLRATAFPPPVEPPVQSTAPAGPRLKLTVPPAAQTGVQRYILTAAQNDTEVNPVVWSALLALAEHYGARLIVGRYVYNLDAMGQRGQEKDAPKARRREKADRWWAPEILPYVLDERLQLAPDLEWCGHINILPTAVRPLADLHSYTGLRSGVFPHPSVALESVPTGKSEPTKINYTTGAVTERNYIQRKAGQKAEFHHVFGGLLVEVDASGAWWARQLNVDTSGVLCDLDLRVQDGRVSTGHPVEAVNWGDIHVPHLEPWMRALCWGDGGLIDRWRPRFQFMHDLVDFGSRSHHDLKNPHEMFRKWAERGESVEAEMRDVRDFLHQSRRQFCTTVVVDSNHDNALGRWLREASHKTDPVNALFYLRMELAQLEAIARGDGGFHLVEHALRHVGLEGEARFLRADESFVICDRADGGGIECGQHGHLGANGARGSPTQFVRTGRRMNVGHGHYALIWQGLYQAGVQASLDHSYNVGMSSWTQSLILTYANGKRAILTCRDRRFHA